MVFFFDSVLLDSDALSRYESSREKAETKKLSLKLFRKKKKKDINAKRVF